MKGGHISCGGSIAQHLNLALLHIHSQNTMPLTQMMARIYPQQNIVAHPPAAYLVHQLQQASTEPPRRPSWSSTNVISNKQRGGTLSRRRCRRSANPSIASDTSTNKYITNPNHPVRLSIPPANWRNNSAANFTLPQSTCVVLIKHFQTIIVCWNTRGCHQ